MPISSIRLRTSIRSQVVAVAFVVFALLAGTLYLVQQRMMLPRFAQIEREQAYSAMNRVSEALARELEAFSISARDWGNWIETFDYLRDRNARYLAVNVNAESLKAIHASFVAFIDNDGAIVASAAYDMHSGNPVEIDYLAHGHLASNDPLRTGLGKTGSVTGIISTPSGPLLVASAPIMNGTGKGPVAGMIVLGRLLTSAELAHGANLRASALRLLAHDERAEGPGARPVERESGLAYATDRVYETDETTFIYRDLRDLTGHTVATLRFAAVREISESAVHTIHATTLLLVVLAATALLVLVYYLKRKVLDPLAEITEHAVQIGASDDLARRLDRAGSDELAALANAFDQMVARLALTRSELIDRSFDAGRAEMASGALHNLGNALTPLSVRVSTLAAALRRAPTEDVERVVAEIAKGNGDEARRADLHQFALLTAEELAHSVENARGDAEAAALQLQAIQRILTDQVRQSRAGPVLESVALGALLAQSIELVAPAKRARLKIEFGPGIEHIATQRLPATVLRQVFQNLVVNAAEAMPERDGRAGRLAIDAEIITDEAHELLVCRFADDGAGIEPDVLPRLFQRRFSTKSNDTNSGIGLHWCANALRLLGGEIRVASDGLGTGACFHVVVPLKSTQVTDAARAA